jgi:hypothetical protein
MFIDAKVLDISFQTQTESQVYVGSYMLVYRLSQ